MCIFHALLLLDFSCVNLTIRYNLTLPVFSFHRPPIQFVVLSAIEIAADEFHYLFVVAFQFLTERSIAVSESIFISPSTMRGENTP